MRISDWSSDVCSSDLKYLALECGQRWLEVRVDGGCARTPLIQCDDIGDLAQGHEQLEPRPLGRADAGTTRATRELYDGRAGVRGGGWGEHDVTGDSGAVWAGGTQRPVALAS